MRITFLFLLVLGGHLVKAQSADDVIAILDAISKVSQLEPLYQVELAAGPTMVILKDTRADVIDNELERTLQLLTNDDLWGFDKLVKIYSEDEMSLEGIRRDQVTGINMRINGDECQVRVSALVQHGDKYLQGWISLMREGFDWKVKGQSIQIR